jgi:hypothetical protein
MIGWTRLNVPRNHGVNLETTLTRVILIAALFMPLQALSWGAEGHQVIAKLAESQLTPKARGEVNRLLALEWLGVIAAQLRVSPNRRSAHTETNWFTYSRIQLSFSSEG